MKKRITNCFSYCYAVGPLPADFDTCGIQLYRFGKYRNHSWIFIPELYYIIYETGTC